MRGGFRTTRGQLTAFFLIGLFVLFVFIVLLLIRNTLQDRLQPGLEKGAYDQKLVQGVVEQCLDFSVEQAFATLGRQGGLLFKEQGGVHAHEPGLEQALFILNEYDQQTDEQVTISFGLVNDSGYPFRPKFSNEYDVNGQNPYPFVDVKLDDLNYDNIAQPSHPENPWSRDVYDGAFGQYALPLLCAARPANESLVACPRSLLQAPGLPHGPSVQESLEAYLAASVDSCVPTDELGALLGADVTKGRADVIVAFTESETLVKLTLPLSFTNDQGNVQTGVFTKRYPVRLLPVYRFTRELLKRASKDPFFQLNDSAAYATLGSNDGFLVTMNRVPPAATANNRMDLFLVTVTDPQSKNNKAMWNFQFLVQNRAPVLEYYQTSNFQPSGTDFQDHLCVKVPKNTNPVEYDIYASFLLASLDPDGEPFSFINQGGCQRNDYFCINPSSCRDRLFVKLNPFPQTVKLSVSDGLSEDWQYLLFENIPNENLCYERETPPCPGGSSIPS